MSIDAETVLEHAARWVWVPDDAVEEPGDGFRLVAYPRHFADPTVCVVTASDRPPAELVEDVLAAVRRLGREGVTFAGLTAAHAGLVDHLVERGAGLREELAVLALDLTAGVPDLDPPADVRVERVEDLAGARDFDDVSTAVFGGTPLGEDQLRAQVQRIREEATMPRFVARRDGTALGCGGLTMVDGVARLWGAAVLPEAQHTGVYRALLQHRLAVAVDSGCRIGLVKGRLDTSAPVLLRAGFVQYGEEAAYHLPPRSG